MKLMKCKKGALEVLTSLAVGLVVFCITVIVAALIAANVKANASVVADANATATANTVQTQIGSLASWLGIIVVAAVGAGLLGLVMLFQGRK